MFARCDGYIYGCNSADSQRENRNVSSRAELGAGQGSWERRLHLTARTGRAEKKKPYMERKEMNISVKYCIPTSVTWVIQPGGTYRKTQHGSNVQKEVCAGQ